MKKKIEIKNGALTYEEVYNFVKEHSSYFIPDFEQQVEDLVLYVDKIMSHASIYYGNYSAIINVEYQELINLTLWQKGSKRHSLLEFVCIYLCNLLIINNSLYTLSLNSYLLC